MTVADVKRVLNARLICGEELLEKEVHSACGSDMMSDVLAYVKDQSVLLSGLVNPQVIRTAQMMDMVCIVFVRGKEIPRCRANFHLYIISYNIYFFNGFPRIRLYNFHKVHKMNGTPL